MRSKNDRIASQESEAAGKGAFAAQMVGHRPTFKGVLRRTRKLTVHHPFVNGRAKPAGQLGGS